LKEKKKDFWEKNPNLKKKKSSGYNKATKKGVPSLKRGTPPGGFEKKNLP